MNSQASTQRAQSAAENRELWASPCSWIRDSGFSIRTFADLAQHHQMSTQKGFRTWFPHDKVILFLLVHLQDREQNSEMQMPALGFKGQPPQQKSQWGYTEVPHQAFRTQGIFHKAEEIWCIFRARNVCPGQPSGGPQATSDGKENEQAQARVGE